MTSNRNISLVARTLQHILFLSWALSLATAVGLTGHALVSGGVDSLSLDLGVEDSSHPAWLDRARLPDRVRLSGVEVSYRPPEGSSHSRWWALLQTVPVWLSALITFKLRRLVMSVVDGSFYNPSNVSRLRWIGGSLMAIEIATRSVGWAVSDTASNLAQSLGLQAPKIEVSFSVSSFVLISGLWTAILGLLALLLAEAIRMGVALREEQSLTV